MYPTSILTPIDFSESSIRAARFALALARRHGTTLSLLHVDHLPAVSMRMAARVAADVWEEYLHERNVSLQRQLDDLARTLGGAQIQTLLSRDDDTARAIVSRAANQSSQLIVMAPHGAGQSQRFLLGSVAFEVAANAPCPVLVTRLGAGRTLPDAGWFLHPVVAVSDAPREITGRLVAALAAPGAVIDLVRVLEPHEPTAGPPLPRRVRESLFEQRAAARARLERAASEWTAAGVTPRVQIEAGDAATTLLEHIVASDNDCIIVGGRSERRGSGPLGAVARRLLQHAPVPVTIVPPSIPQPEQAP
jgi:nucleotide-binding universal stress UspA family protein